MAKNNETTTKFKVDISELKKGIQEANRQIRLANSEFKAATSGMDKWSDSADGISAKIKQLNSVLEAQKSKLENLKKQYELTVAEQGETSAGAEELRIKINNQKAVVGETEKEIRNYNTRLNEMRTAANNAANEQTQVKTTMDKLKDTINQQEQDLVKLKNQYSNLVLEHGESSQAAQNLANQIDTLSNELNENRDKLARAESAADEFDNTLEDVEESTSDASNGFTVMTGALANLVADGIRMAIGKLKELATESIEVGKEFDSAMSKVGAVSGATSDDMDILRDKAKEMGSTTKFTATEAAEAFNYMAMAGWKTEDMINGIDGILNLAAASGSDLATTSDIVTDALTAMGYKAEDAGRLADVMAAASSNANTNVELMGHTFQYAAPIVGALGYSMEDTAVQIGLMANAGIKGEKAGTALRSILTRLSAPPKECAKEMEKLGISMTDSEGNMKSLDEVTGDLRTAFRGLSETEQTTAAKHIAGQEAMSGLLAIVNAAPEDFDKLTEAVENSEGVASSMADTMLNNLGGDMTLLSSKLEGVQLAIYEKFEPALKKGVEVLDKLLDGVQFVIDHSTEFVAALTGMATALGVYLAYTTAVKVMKEGWMSLAVVQKIVAAGQAALNAVMALNPIGLVIAAVVGLVAAFVVLWKKSDSFRKFWINLWEKIKKVAGAAWKAISKIFSDAWNAIKEIWSVVAAFFQKIWERIKAVFEPVVEFFKEKFQAAWNKVKKIWSVVADFFTSVWEGIKKVFEPVADAFKFIFELAWSVVKFAWGTAVTFFKLIWIGIKAVFKPVAEWFKDVFAAAWKKVKAAWNGVAEFFSAVWDSITEIFSSISAWFKSKFSAAWSEVKIVWSNAEDFFDDLWEAIKSTFKNVGRWFSDRFSAAWKNVKNAFSGVAEFFGGVWDTITSKFSDIGTVVGEAIGGAFKRAINAVIDTVENTLNFIPNHINPLLQTITDWTGQELPYMPYADLPRLAKGGVVNRSILANIGEDGAEAVVPLEKNTKWLDEIAKRLYTKMDLPNHLAFEGPQTSTTINNFYQTNNSPKALSRLEIYRQSKNLLLMKR